MTDEDIEKLSNEFFVSIECSAGEAIMAELRRARESEMRLVEALTKAADSFRDAAMTAAILGRPIMAEAMKIAEKGTRKAISAAGVKDE